jgi:inositol oxygenase
MGRGRRHVPDRLRVFGPHRFFGILCRQPDSRVPAYQTRLGIYEENGGLDHVHLSWGHDEYLFHVIKDYLPDPALYMIRYHSFYPAHKEGAYGYLMNERDRTLVRHGRARLQPVRPVFQERGPPRRGKTAPVLRGSDRRIFPGHAALVDARKIRAPVNAR